MPDDQNSEQTPLDSAYLFNADAQAIYNTSTDLDSGLNSLAISLQKGNWDDSEKATQYAQDYATKLIQKFPKESQSTFSAENAPAIAPVLMQNVEASKQPESSIDIGKIATDVSSFFVPGLDLFNENPVVKYGIEKGKELAGEAPPPVSENDKAVSRINNWEKQNLDQLEQTQDPAYVMVKDHIAQSIKDYASQARRSVNAENENWLSDTYNREIEGATGNILKLFGADEAIKNLYEHTDPSVDGSIRGKIASALGSTAGFVGSGYTGPLGFYAYASAQAGGALKSSYEDTLKATGDSGRATIAAGLEAISQGFAIGGGSLLSSATKPVTEEALKSATEGVGKAVSETFGPEVTASITDYISKALKSGAVIGGLNTTAGIISEGAHKYGQGATAANSLPGEKELGGALEDFAINTAIGTGLHLLPQDRTLTKPAPAELTPADEPLKEIKIKTGPVPVTSETPATPENISSLSSVIPAPTSGISFKTELEHGYIVSSDGKSTQRTNESGQSFQPMTRTFYPDASTAAKVSILENSITPDGGTPWVSTDGDKLYVNSQYIGADLAPTSKPTGTNRVEIPASEVPAIGLYPVEVGIQQNGSTSKVPSYFGGKITELNVPDANVESIGAFKAGQLVPSERVQKLISSGTVSPEVAGLLQQWGADSHIRISRDATLTKAWDYIRENGLGSAYERLLTRGEHENSDFLLSLADAASQHYEQAAEFEKGLGNTESELKLRTLSAEMREAQGQISENLGRGLGQHNILDPVSVAQKHIADAVTTAKEEVANQEGVTIDDLIKNEKELQTTNEQITQIEDAAQEKADKVNKEAKANAKPAKEGGPKKEIPLEPKENFLSPDEKATLDALKEKKKPLEAQATKVKAKVAKAVEKATPEAERIKKLLDKARTATGRYKDDLHRAAFKEGNKLNSLRPFEKNIWRRLWNVNEISAPSTLFRKVTGEITQAVATVFGDIGALKPGKGVSRFKAISKSAAQETSNLISDLRDAWRKGGYDEAIRTLITHQEIVPETRRKGKDTKKGELDFGEGSQSRLFRDEFSQSAFSPEEFSKKIPKSVRAGLARSLNTVIGGFSGGRAIYVRSLWEGFANARAYEIAKKENIGGEPLRERVAEKLFNSKETWNRYLKQAQEEAQDLKENKVADWTNRDIRVRAAELMTAARDSEINLAAQQGSNHYDFSTPTSGWTGRIFKGLQKLIEENAGFDYKDKEYNPISYLFRFMTVEANILHNQLEWVPGAGHFMAFGSSADPESRNYLHPDVKENIYGKANIGLVGAAVLAAKLYSQKDDKEPAFDIHGSGPSDPASRKVFRDSGRIPYSIEINTPGGRKSVPLRLVSGPLAMILGMAGAMNDTFKYDIKNGADPKTVEDKMKAFGLAISSSVLRNITNEPFLKNWGMLVDSFYNKDYIGIANSLTLQPAKGFIPLVGLDRYINKFIATPRDSYNNLLAKVIADTPVATVGYVAEKFGANPKLTAPLGVPRLNGMGERIEEGWFSEHGPLADFIVGKSRDPEFSWMADNGWHIPDPKRNVHLNGLVSEEEMDPQSNPGAVIDNVLTSGERAQILERAAPQVRAIVKQYRELLGSHPYDRNIQAGMSKAINAARNQAKYDLFIAPKD